MYFTLYSFSGTNVCTNIPNLFSVSFFKLMLTALLLWMSDTNVYTNGHEDEICNVFVTSVHNWKHDTGKFESDHWKRLKEFTDPVHFMVQCITIY